MNNGLDNIMPQINQTISALAFKNFLTAQKGKKFLRAFMSVSPSVLVIALAILIPVILMIGINTEEVLLLFLKYH